MDSSQYLSNSGHNNLVVWGSLILVSPFCVSHCGSVGSFSHSLSWTITFSILCRRARLTSHGSRFVENSVPANKQDHFNDRKVKYETGSNEQESGFSGEHWLYAPSFPLVYPGCSGSAPTARVHLDGPLESDGPSTHDGTNITNEGKVQFVNSAVVENGHGSE